MRIGLDMTVIQTPHRMRGIGAVAIHFVKNIPQNLKKDMVFVIYLYKEGQEEALSILDLNDVTYEIKDVKKEEKVKLNIPRRFAILESVLNNLRENLYSYIGDPRIDNDDDLDVFLQFDQMQSLPRLGGVKTGVILYDLIPYVMERDYLWGYKTSRKNGKSRKGSLRKAYLRHKYIAKAKRVAKSANMLFAISKYTKDDFVKYAKIKSDKIDVIHLGIDELTSPANNSEPSFKKYVENSWGSFPKSFDIKEKNFLLFLGGADSRRRLVDLVVAYNHLKAQGHDIRLLLAGDIMTGPNAIPSAEVQDAIKNSSYCEDIVFLGFVTDEQKEWLYANAIAMVYPSVYEGFGLPVLEAMQQGTPVITYKNTSIYEVAGDAAIYASDGLSIKKAVEDILSNSKRKSEYISKGKKMASKFPWKTTSKKILNNLLN